MTNFSGIGFNYIADTANIICIFPQAVTDQFAGTAWNSGAGSFGYYPNANVNDIGFINALIDTAISNYSIDNSRVYLCGFSMGGFMTQKMALISNAKIAAFASMSGTIGSGVTSFNPGRPIPIAHFHGTADTNVPFSGNSFGFDPDSMVQFWVNNNSCNSDPDSFSYPDLANDTINIDRFEYSSGDPQSEVWFYKMYGAKHTVLFQPANDITEPVELWLFLQRHTLPAAGLKENIEFSKGPGIFPNPANKTISIRGISSGNKENSILIIRNLQGQLELKKSITSEKNQVDISAMPPGMYLFEFSGPGLMETKKFIKE